MHLSPAHAAKGTDRRVSAEDTAPRGLPTTASPVPSRRQLGFSHVLAMLREAAMQSHMQVSPWTPFYDLESTGKGGIAGLEGKCLYWTW